MNQLLTDFDHIVSQLVLMGISREELLRRIGGEGGVEE